MNRTQAAACKYERISVFTFSQSLDTRQAQHNVLLVSSHSDGIQWCQSIVFYSPCQFNILTVCKTEVKVEKLTCSMFSWDPDSCHSESCCWINSKIQLTSPWPAAPLCIQIGAEQEHISKQSKCVSVKFRLINFNTFLSMLDFLFFLTHELLN